MNEEKKLNEIEETEAVPVDEKNETIHFPWGVAIVIGVLMLLILICFKVIRVYEG